MDKVFNSNGKKIVLGNLIAQGGEGEIRSIIGAPNLLLKIYLDKYACNVSKITQLTKLDEVAKRHNSPLYTQAALPKEVIYDSNHNAIGYIMNKLPGERKLEDACSYPPDPSFLINGQQMVQIGIDICKLLEEFHKVEVCFGDFHPGNILIDKKGTVYFVDTDTVQFSKKGNIYKCVSCRPGYTSPEALRATRGSRFANHATSCFTEQTDNWCLALHLYALLFNGSNPYDSILQNSSNGSIAYIPEDERVLRGITPFNGGKQAKKEPEISAFPSYIQSMFTRAFVKGHTNPSVRPTAKEWEKALIKYKSELRKCSKEPTHYYWKNCPKCPYCEVDKRIIYPAIKRQQLKNTTPHNPATIPAQNLTHNPVMPPAQAINNPPFATNAAAKVVKKVKAYHTKEDKKHYLGLWIYSLITSGLIQFITYTVMKHSSIGFIIDDYGYLCIGILLVGGILGPCIYNINWSTYARKGPVRWWDYPLCFLSILGGIAAVTITLALFAFSVAVTLAIFALILAIIILRVCFAILSAFCNG